MEQQRERSNHQSQTITIEPQQQSDTQDDFETIDGSIFISNSSQRDLDEAMRKMKQYQREYWIEFAAQRGMSFTAEPGPSDREPEPPPEDDPPMRMDSVIPPKKMKSQGTVRPRSQFDTRAQHIQAPVSRIPRMAPVPRIEPLKLEPIRVDEEEEEEEEQTPPRPIIIPPKIEGHIPERERLYARNTNYHSQMYNHLEKRLHL